MPAQSRQTSAPSTAPKAPTSAPPARSTAQDRVGNAGMQDRIGPLKDQIPDQIDLESAGVSFSLPGPVDLTEGWNRLGTTTRTRTWITMGRTDLRVSFEPPLLLDAQWPLSNVALGGFTYDFRKGAVTRVDVENTQMIAIPISGKVDGAVRDFVQGLVAGTPLGKPGYDPLTDGDVTGTLKRVQANFSPKGAGGKKEGGIDEKQIQDLSFSASARVRKAIEVASGGSGLSIPAGASLDLTAAVDGNAADLGKRMPNVQHLYIGSSGITLQKDGKPVARLRSLTIDRGGAVDVTDFEPLGTLAEVGAGESLVRLLGLLVAVRTGDGRFAGDGNIEPRAVNGLAEREMEKGFTDVVRQLVIEHHDVVPGVDLRTLLGVESKADKS